MGINIDKIVYNLVKMGFTISEAYRLLYALKLIKPFVVYEEKGFGIINDYSLSKIIVSD